MSFLQQKIGRYALALTVFYLVFLITTVTMTSFKYRKLYAPPEIGVTLSEDTALRVWADQHDATYDDYRNSVRLLGLSLALFLPSCAAAIGIWRNSFVAGVVALALGGIFTVLALSVLPWIYFPFDKYAVSAIWMMFGAPVAVITWGVLLAVGLRCRRNGCQLSAAGHSE